MSAEATGWVYRYSPYKGVQFQTHLAVADSVNDQYGNDFWMTQKKLAVKARCTRQSANQALASMVEDGFLALLGWRGRDVRRYRFLFPEVDVVYETRFVADAPLVKPADKRGMPLSNQPTSDGGSADMPLSNQPTSDVGSADTEPKKNPKTTQTEQYFDRFWAIYPLRREKIAARKAWDSAIRRGAPEAILAGAERFASDPNRDPEFTKNPATWLNKGCWDDDPAPARSRGEARHNTGPRLNDMGSGERKTEVVDL